MSGITTPTVTLRRAFLSSLLLFSTSTNALPIPLTAPLKSTFECRCAVMPADTPFYPSTNPASSSPLKHASTPVDTCAVLGPQLQHWRDATLRGDDLDVEAAKLESWVLGQDERVAKAASEILWGARPVPTSALLTASRPSRGGAGTGRSKARPGPGARRRAGAMQVLGKEEERMRGRVVCRSVAVTKEENDAEEDVAVSMPVPGTEVGRTSNGRDSRNMPFVEEMKNAWFEPEKHIFALKLVVVVLILLCVVEVSEDIYSGCRRRRKYARRGAIALWGDEKAWYKSAGPELESIPEEEESGEDELDTPLP